MASPNPAALPAAESAEVGISAFAGLHKEWDNDLTLRERVRSLGRLCVEKPEKGEQETASDGVIPRTAENLRYNAAVLRNMVARMQGQTAPPSIDALQSELTALYSANRLNPTAKVVSDQSWSIRYLYGVLKSYQYKDKAPKAGHFRPMCATMILIESFKCGM